MKTSSWSLLILFSFVTITSLTGCGKPEPKSMTEGVPLSEIEAYEKAVLEMEAEDAGDMELDEREAEPPAE